MDSLYLSILHVVAPQQHFQYFFLFQGFKDLTLTVWDASCVLRNYEVRTKKTISPEQLQDGSLASLLEDSDYNLSQSVSALFTTLITYFPDRLQ